MIWWFISTKRWTVAVATEREKPFTIVETPPIVRRFSGQPFRNLIRWARNDPDWQLAKLP